MVWIVEPRFMTNTLTLVEDPLAAEVGPMTRIETGAGAVPVTVNDGLVGLVAPR